MCCCCVLEAGSGRLSSPSYKMQHTNSSVSNADKGPDNTLQLREAERKEVPVSVPRALLPKSQESPALALSGGAGMPRGRGWDSSWEADFSGLAPCVT